MNEEVLQFLENYLKKNDNKFTCGGQDCSRFLIVSSDGIIPIDFTRLCKIFARHSKLFEITFDSMYNNEMNIWLFNIFIHIIDINFVNFAQDYYLENMIKGKIEKKKMTVSSINFFNCRFDNWEFKYQLAGNPISKVKFSRMFFFDLKSFELIQLIFRLFGT